MDDAPSPDDVRRASALATRWALRSLLHRLYVDNCMAAPDPVAEAKRLLETESDAMDRVAAPAVGGVDAEMVKHLVLDEIETFLQGVAEEVSARSR